MVSLSKIKIEEFDEYSEVLSQGPDSSGGKKLLKNPDYIQSLFNELFESKTFYCTIRKKEDKKFCGYCGVKRTGVSRPELAIELLESMWRKGIGYRSVKLLMKFYASQETFEYFRFRVAVNNYASQILLEKLGAVPNGISALLIEDLYIQKKIEERYMHLIDEKMIQLAEKFAVEPRKLLSHVLEYKLNWEEARI